MDEGFPQEVQLSLAWVGTEDMPIFHINQFLGQVGATGEVFLNFGQMTPPPLLGTPEQQAQQIQQIAFVPVKPIARLAITRDYLAQVILAMQQTLQNYDIAQQMERGDER